MPSMEYIFIDESEYNKKEKKDWFILCGLMIHVENLLALEESIRELKEKNKIKELRRQTRYDQFGF